ncbi:unnamed protein product [Allacma fusca]|uniref:Major facilitator superfamily (MFS) profile domain-containing protein n=1 Tax=Allacma fusca TaxID=39272 RepID=A0A8J2PYW9_9HEXA|nr:unnamed protein product [Allacma fusca]
MNIEQREKCFKQKRLKSFIIVSGYFFFEGCEDVVILPTCWNFLQTLGVTEEHWLGYTISIYSVAAAIAGMIGGRLADKYWNHTKAIIFSSIIFRSIGHLQYMLGLNVWNILISRTICGLGAAAGTSAIAEICRTTTPEERRTFISIITAAFQIGILVGPGLQLFLSYFNFSLFGLAVTPLNAPGLFMGLLWLLYWVATSILFTNLTQEFQEIQKLKLGIDSGQQEAVAPILEITNQNNEKPQEGSDIYSKYMHEFLTDSYVLLTWMVLTLYFQQVALETVIPVITQDYFGFGVHENTLIYCFEKGNNTHVVYFLVGTFLFYLGSPIFNVGNTALASKVLSTETQGLGQGIRRMMSYIGLIFGPTWAGSTVHNPRLFIGLTLALLFVNVKSGTVIFTN